MSKISGHLTRRIQPVQFSRDTQKESAKRIIDETTRVFASRSINDGQRFVVSLQPERIVVAPDEFSEQAIERLFENFHAAAVAYVAARGDETEQEWASVC